MIKSIEDYKEYLSCDKKVLGVSDSFSIKNFFYPKKIWVFQKMLRKLEYYTNCKHSLIDKIYLKYLRYKFSNLSLKLGFSIPPNVFGKGLAIAHYGTIVVNSNARIGAYCRIHVGVNIGASAGSKKAPTIGNYTYIAPGAKIYGDISVPSYTAIGANSVVNKSFEEEGFMIAGIPAKKIKEFDVKTVINS